MGLIRQTEADIGRCRAGKSLWRPETSAHARLSARMSLRFQQMHVILMA